jgi:hypothetical protein
VESSWAVSRLIAEEDFTYKQEEDFNYIQTKLTKITADDENTILCFACIPNILLKKLTFILCSSWKVEKPVWILSFRACFL